MKEGGGNLEIEDEENNFEVKKGVEGDGGMKKRG